MNLFYRFLLISLLTLSFNLFASSSPFDASVLASWLEKQVLGNVGEKTNCASNQQAAVSLLGQDDNPFQVIRSDVVALAAPRKNGVWVHGVTLNLPWLAESPLVRPHIHSFIILQDKKSLMLCDSFESVYSFSCKTISPKQVELINRSVANYIGEQTSEAYQVVTAQFLGEQAEKIYNDTRPISNPYKGQGAHFHGKSSDDIDKFFSQLRSQTNRGGPEGFIAEGEELDWLNRVAQEGIATVSKISFIQTTLPGTSASCGRER